MLIYDYLQLLLTAPFTKKGRNMTNSRISEALSRMRTQSTGSQPMQAIPNSTDSSTKFNLTTVSTWLLLAFVALLPVIMVPLTNNFVIHSKLFLIVFTAIFAGLLFFINSFKKHVWQFIVSPITLPLVIFGLTVAASTFFTQYYPVENLLGLGGVYLGSILIALFGSSLIRKEKTNLVLPVLVASVCVVNLASLLQLFGYGPTQIINALTGFELEHNMVFNLSSSAFIALQIGVVALIGSLVKIFKSKKVTTFEVITLPLLILGIGLHLWAILPGQPAAITLPPIAASWSVALDSLRVPRSALIGQGLEGYTNTFARYKPTAMNSNQYWQFNFGSAMGMPLTALVQIGFLGLIAWLILAGRFFTNIKNYKDVANSPITWMLGASFLIQFFLPPNYVVVGLQGALIAFWIARFKDQFFTLKLRTLSASLDSKDVVEGSRINQEKNRTETVISLVTNGLVIIGLLLLTFVTGKAYASFNRLYQASKAYVANDGVAVYEQQQKAVTLNPYLDSTRRSYALTNLQIAIALSNKADVTEAEQEQISLLIQQAVREAQAATSIDPLDSENWSVLAQIYQQLIGSVDQADQWAVNAYVEAIQVSPADPLLRIQLGSILLDQKQIQQAANLFSQATELKPDLAAAYFYLGQTQRLGQDVVGAKRSWQQALALVPAESEDYTLLQGLLDEIEPEVQQVLQAQQEQLEQEQATATGTQQLTTTTEGTSALGQQLPSLTDQNIEDRQTTVNEPGTEPLELTPEEAALVQQSQQPTVTTAPVETEPAQ